MKLPPIINTLCRTLIDSGARPILVGGYVRDFFLKQESKDIDIEVYDIPSLDKLKKSLCQLGPVHDVGKSFGVLKINIDGFDFDISLPRTEQKIAKGHKGFDVKTDPCLDFKTAASRRDFSMNAIGYDVKTQSFLDPFNGQEDIQNKIIRHVSDKSFAEDPLRILRAVQFSARFNFKLHTNTLTLCQNMVKKDMLAELPKERVFEEYKKLLLKANKPSVGFYLLDKMNALFPEIKTLSENSFDQTMSCLDAMVTLITKDTKTNLLLMLSSLCYKLKNTDDFFNRLSNEKNLIDKVTSLTKSYRIPSKFYENKAEDSAILKLSTKVNIENLILLSHADYIASNQNTKKYPAGEWLRLRAIKLEVLNEEPKALIQGRDLIKRGLNSGKEFKNILNDAYEAQLNRKFTSYDDAQLWLDNYLSS